MKSSRSISWRSRGSAPVNDSTNTARVGDRGQRFSDAALHAYCLDWVRWCENRKFYMPPVAQSLLGRMQPKKSGDEPNIRNDPDMGYFNLAIGSLKEMPDHVDGWACFRLMYIEKSDHIKRKADELGISRPTYYARARKFARKALEFANTLKQRKHGVNTEIELAQVS